MVPVSSGKVKLLWLLRSIKYSSQCQREMAFCNFLEEMMSC